MADAPNTTIAETPETEGGTEGGESTARPYFLPSEHNLGMTANSLLGRDRRQTMREVHGR